MHHNLANDHNKSNKQMSITIMQDMDWTKLTL